MENEESMQEIAGSVYDGSILKLESKRRGEESGTPQKGRLT